MTIKEWLTPDLFALSVILVTLMVCWTIFAIVSNFLEDFDMSDRVQITNYLGAIFMTVIFFLLTAVIEPINYLYPNPYNWLLIGEWPIIASVAAGVVLGAVVAWKFGSGLKLKIAAATGAVISEAIIGSFMLLWILNQT